MEGEKGHDLEGEGWRGVKWGEGNAWIVDG